MKFQDLLRSKAAQISGRAEHRIVRRLAGLADDLPGVSIRAEGSEIRLAGHGLRRRAISDARLRWPGAWLRSLL
ncbi:hypothetical protein [Sphingosinicella microcystinivorans]|uniref:Uncharacterized protein n=1 Tax=Sphingosinicella microcystinivorans TaxID=335406 RepID=A0AAD1D305_SPHMI|nr:hypothetical protein [Sphingosinicella microcystinivorans]RKS89146.1 hypothetical protein DFR51_2360 [Sphingosinicella microcystinivorans]BBE32902.1 hypothetical protein SmB9_05600 [Sphingosinicella microcystinivorans]